MSEHTTTTFTTPDCYRCGYERDDADGLMLGWVATHMFVCPTCGNKRCPKATDHRLDCTGSNEPEQPGSRFRTAPPTDRFSRLRRLSSRDRNQEEYDRG